MKCHDGWKRERPATVEFLDHGVNDSDLPVALVAGKSKPTSPIKLLSQPAGQAVLILELDLGTSLGQVMLVPVRRATRRSAVVTACFHSIELCIEELSTPRTCAQQAESIMKED